MSEADPCCRAAKRLDCDHARQLSQEIAHLQAGRFDEAEVHVLPLHHVPLKAEQFAHAVAKAIRHDQNARGQRQPGHGEQRLRRAAFEIPHGNPERMREQVTNAGAFNERRAEVCRRLGSHRLRRRQLRRASHGAEDAEQRRARAHSERQHHRRAIEPEIQVRKAEEQVIHHHEPMAQRHPAQRADHCSADHHDERKFQVVQDDLPVRQNQTL